MSNFVCDDCGSSFKRRENMQYHVKNKVCSGGSKTAKHSCRYCNKNFTTATIMYRHVNHTCKVRKNEENKKDEIFERLINLENENKTLKKRLMTMEDKIDEKTNNVNNGVINHGKMNLTVNNNYIVGYGKEDHSIINRDELLQVFRSGFNSPLRLTETMHFNSKYPEFHNVYISSMKNKYAMMYDGNEWTLVMKDDLIDKLYDNKRDYIEENLDEFLESLTRSQRKALHRWMNAGDDHPYIAKIKNDIKLLLYNKRCMPINNKLQCIDRADNIIDIDRSLHIVKDNSINVSASRNKVIKPHRVYKEPKHTNTKPIWMQKPPGRPGTKRKILNR